MSRPETQGFGIQEIMSWPTNSCLGSNNKLLQTFRLSGTTVTIWR